MFENIKDKLASLFMKKIYTYNFNETGYESLTNENLTRMFYADTFNSASRSEQIKMMQERINRLTRDAYLFNKLRINLTPQTKADVEFSNGEVRVNPRVMGNSIMLYAFLAGAVEKARQEEYANAHPNSALGKQVKGFIIQTKTGTTYDHKNIESREGLGCLAFLPTMGTNMTLGSELNYNLPETLRENAKLNPSYYIRRLSPAERGMAKVLEGALDEMRVRLDEDKEIKSLSRDQYNFAARVIGKYEDDRLEYKARTRLEKPEEEIDAFLDKTGSGRDFQSRSDVLDTDIRLAAIYTYNKLNNISYSLTNDPRFMMNFTEFQDNLTIATDEEFRRYFYPENWEKLNLEEKKLVIQEQCTREQLKLGLTKNYLVSFENMHDGAGAFYVNGNSVVHFDTKLLNSSSPLCLYNMIPHELIHARQDEIGRGFIPASDSQRLFNAYHWRVIQNITTPSHYHNTDITQINVGLENNKRTEFVFMDSHVVGNFDMRRVREASVLYRLQPIEREAYEYQEAKNRELKGQMEQEGVLDNKSKFIFNYMSQSDISVFEAEAKATYGCTDPTRAITEFQTYACGLSTDYDPQTADFDFAMRFQSVSISTYDQYKIYPEDPRSKMMPEPTLDMDLPEPEWRIPGVVADRMSMENQQNPPVYVRPLTDEIITEKVNENININEETQDNVDKKTNEDINEKTNDRHNNIDRNEINDQLSDEDIEYIMKSLGDPNDLTQEYGMEEEGKEKQQDEQIGQDEQDEIIPQDDEPEL